jgi:hypothetical protein
MQPLERSIALNPRSWEWLLEVSLRLDVIIEILDEDDGPLLTRGPGSGAADLRRLLTAGDPLVAAALVEARGSNGPTEIALAGFQALGFGLSSGAVLVLARELNVLAEDGRATADRKDLEHAAAWLTGAIRTSLAAQPNDINPELYRLSSLKRILGDTGSLPSARKVLGAFVEALSVWDSVRVRCYAAGADGGFLHFVSPVGAPVSDVPAGFDPAFCVDTDRLVRLERTAADDLGLAADVGDVLMLQLFAGTAPGWLLFFSGVIDAAAQARLVLYADLLRESLDAVRDRAVTRATSGIPRDARDAMARTGTLEASVDAALRPIAAAVGAQHSALTVTTVTGMRALTVGELAAVGTDPLVVTSADAASVMTMTLGRAAHVPFTALEREIVSAAAAALHPWIQASLLGASENERRRGFRPLDSLFDHIAGQAVVSGQDASVIVVAVDPGVAHPGLLQSWLGNIRIQLRGSDFAGMLSDCEIAVLLCDASADQATAVSARLRDFLHADEGAGGLRPVLSTTTSSPRSPFEGSLVAAARAAARVH